MNEIDAAPEAPERARARLDTLAATYADARTVVDNINEQRAGAYARLDRATADLFDAMEQLGLRSVRTATMGTFSLSDLADAKVIDAATFVEWAKQNAPEILHPNFQRLSKLVRDHLKGEYDFPEASDLPPGVDFTTRRGITWRGRPQ